MPEPEPPRLSRITEELIGDLRGVPFDEPRRQVRRPTTNLNELLNTLLDKHQIGRESPEHTVRENWRDLVGPAAAAYSNPALIDPRGRLTVLVQHAVVRNELFFHRKTIVARIQKLPGCAKIKDLNLRAG